MAGAEWDVIRGRIVQSHCKIMRDGYWVGRPPFGYEVEGDRYRKVLVPAGGRRDAQGRQSRPKVPTICTRPISVAQVLADTANPARTLGVL
jgi:hypothetical protein